MKNILLTLILVIHTLLNSEAQIVIFSDTNFKAKLLSLGIDLNKDNEIQENEAKVVQKLNIESANITDLTGIASFSNLSFLNCNSNQLNSLDVSKNILLTELFCSYNQLTSLNISKNISLTVFHCNDNQLSALDVSNNIELQVFQCGNNSLNKLDLRNNNNLYFINCYNNQLLTLDVSKNLKLFELYCIKNELTTLDVSNNFELRILKCTQNQLKVICINTSQQTDSWTKDDSASWSSTCFITSIEDYSNQKNKRLFRILTPLGQKIEPEQAIEGLFIFQYMDGSSEKIIRKAL